jgi:YbbR domain-containing protein
MRTRITKNLGLKLVSFVLAILLWYNISHKGMTEISKEVYLEYINIPAGYEIVDKDVDRVNLNVYGSEQIIKNLKQGDIRVVIDLEDAKVGKQVFKITRDNIKIPSALTVTDIQPSTVTILLDRITKKQLPVRVRFRSKLNRKLFEVRVSPPTVEVKGPASLLTKLTYIDTEPVKIDKTLPEKIVVPISGNYKKLSFDVEKVEVLLTPKKKP